MKVKSVNREKTNRNKAVWLVMFLAKIANEEKKELVK